MPAVILALSLLTTWVWAQGSILYASVVFAHSPMLWLLASTGVFLMARATGRTITGRVKRSRAMFAASGVALLALYLCWALARTIHLSDQLDRGFPFPDPWIVALEHWLDVQHPVSIPGNIKLHGEFPRIEWLVGSAISILVIIDSLILGFLTNPVRPASGK